MNDNQIPRSTSVEELAQFWDTHDLMDFEDELEEVKEPIFERENLISIRLPLQEIERVKKMAESQGIDYHDLIRKWVLEKVSQV